MVGPAESIFTIKHHKIHFWIIFAGKTIYSLKLSLAAKYDAIHQSSNPRNLSMSLATGVASAGG